MCQVSSSYSLLLRCHCLRVMHLIPCHLVHCICIHVHLMHSSFFPVVRFAFRRFVLLRWSFLVFFRVWGLNISGLDRVLPSGLGLLPVDRLSSFGSFGLRLILQRLTEGPRRPHVCCIPTPLQSGPKPTKTLSIISVVRSRSRGQKPHLIWTLLAPSMPINSPPPKFTFPSSPETLDPLLRSPDNVRRHRTCPARRGDVFFFELGFGRGRRDPKWRGYI